MSHRAALYVFAGIALVLACLLIFVDGAGIFLARRIIDLIDWIAVWR